MQDRPFLTIDEQVERLKTRGLSVDDETPSILLREGYYSIVNGYKTPFIDAEATEKAGDDRYNSGTSLMTSMLSSALTGICARSPSSTSSK